MTKKIKKNILIIVESPNKIKKIMSFLGDGYSVCASFGHIMDLASNKTNPLGINIENDFEPIYNILHDKKDKLAAIIKAASTASEIYLATDFDREGEAIAFHLKDCLESVGVPIKRIVFNEITKSAVLKAVQNPGYLNEDLYYAQQARRILDRLVGFMVSPYLIKSVAPNLSAGRVQSVAVRLIIDREREIENFKPEEYWNITATLAKPLNKEDKFDAKYIKKLNNKTDAMKIKADLDKDDYEVVKVEAKEKKRNPLPPLTTPKLQQVAVSRYGLSVLKTMQAAQSLYESGLVTYIRTDSTRLSPEAIISVREWLVDNNYNIPKSPNIYSSGNSAQDAHEAIRPTDVSRTPDKAYLTDDQQKVYRIIWERFVSCQMEPAIYDTMNVLIKSSSGHDLKANGRTLKYAGWLAVATDQLKEKKTGDEDDIQLPNLSVNDDLTLVPPKVRAEQKFTQPPPRYGEGSLVKELERRGIGRPSTYAEIIEKIKNRGYVVLKGKVYYGTDTGKTVIDALTKYFKFMEYDYTANMEEQLDSIADGKLTYVGMLDAFFKPFQAELKSAYIDKQTDYGFVCECGNKMFVKHGKYGFYLACIDYPSKCKHTISCDMIDNKPVVKETFRETVSGNIRCPKCNSDMMKRDGKFGPFYSCIKYPKCNGSRKIPSGEKCKKCGDDLYFTIFNDEPKLACMGYPNCKNVVDVPKKIHVDWVNPKDIKFENPKKPIKKILNASR